MISPPRIKKRLLFKGGKCNSSLLEEYMVAVYDNAAINPQPKPVQLIFMDCLSKFVARIVPDRIVTTAMIFRKPGALLYMIISTKTLIHTVCINNTMATLTGIYCTDR